MVDVPPIVAVLQKDTSYRADAGIRGAIDVFTFDPGIKLLDDMMSASYVVEIVDEASLDDDKAGVSDDKLTWQVIAEVNWIGGNHTGYGGNVRPPGCGIRSDGIVAGRRIRWRAIADKVGLSIAVRSVSVTS